MSDGSVVAGWIVSRIDHLAAEAFAGMYANPFWDARFGDRGRRHALEDQRHHLKHLVLALNVDHPELLTEYATWLQVVLTSRGMCTRHLADNFIVLRNLMGLPGGSEGHPARLYLEMAVDALIYRAGPEGALHAAADSLADRAVTVVCGTQSATPSAMDADQAQCQDDLSYHLSYLADALALGRPDLFAAHVRWTAGFFITLGRPRDVLRRELLGLDNVLAEHPVDQYHAARTVLRHGIDALEEQRS
jgi:hypothetical protein